MLRSRSALLSAAVRLVSERGTTAVPVTDVADQANVSRQLVYLQFGDLDSLLVAAAVDLVSRDLIPHTEGIADTGVQVLTMARHFAGHRPFYRAMLTGSCAFAMTRTLNDLFGSLNAAAVRDLLADQDEETVQDLGAFVAGGTGAIVNDWLIDGADPLDPEELAERLLRLRSVFVGSHHIRLDGGRHQ